MDVVTVQENLDVPTHEASTTGVQDFPTCFSVEQLSQLRGSGSSPAQPSAPCIPSIARPHRDVQRPHRSVRPRSPVYSAEAEQWMHTRLANITLDQLSGDSLVIYSTYRIQPPPGYENIWLTYGEQHSRRELSSSESRLLSQAFTCLVFCDVHANEHFQCAKDIAKSVCSLGTLAPCIMLIPHSESRAVADHRRQTLDPDAGFSMISQAMDAGMDDCIVREASGLGMAYEIQSRILQQIRNVALLNDKVNQHRTNVENMAHLQQTLQEGISETVWEYLRIRLKTGIPAIDYEIEPGQPGTLDGYVVSAQLGQGAFGVVCKLLDPAQQDSAQVVKMVNKMPHTSCKGLKTLNRQLGLLHMLSSRKYGHPNIIKFYQVYHSETHLHFRMENGGPYDLYRRLSLRDRGDAGMQIGNDKAKHIITQCLAGISHLHVRASVAHRDLKPENIVLSETEYGVTVKVTDLDTACVLHQGELCCGGIGTFPFMAPEIVLEPAYDAFAADVWSIGTVFLEVVCHLNVLKKAVRLASPRRLGDPFQRKALEKQMLQKIRAFFSVPGHVKVVLETYINPELRDIFEAVHILHERTLDVSFENRWKADAAAEASADLFGISGYQHLTETSH